MHILIFVTFCTRLEADPDVINGYIACEARAN